MLPLALVNPLKDHLKRVKELHEKELAEGFGKVYLPYALEKTRSRPLFPTLITRLEKSGSLLLAIRLTINFLSYRTSNATA